MRGSLATTTFSFAAAGEGLLVQSIYIQRLPNDILGGFTLFGLSEGAAGIESPRGSYKVSGFPPPIDRVVFFPHYLHCACLELLVSGERTARQAVGLRVPQPRYPAFCWRVFCFHMVSPASACRPDFMIPQAPE